MQPFAWKQPMGGKAITWRSLKVGDRMDLDANYSASHTISRKKYAEYALRIVTCEGVNEKFQVDDFREWDDYDLEAFAEEVVLQETIRANALSSQRPGSPVERVEQAINAAQVAASKMGLELTNVLAAIKSAERSIGPLGQAPTS